MPSGGWRGAVCASAGNRAGCRIWVGGRDGRREGERGRGERRLIGLEKETEIKLGLEREEVSCTGRRGRRSK